MNERYEKFSTECLAIDWREVWARLGGAALTEEKIESVRAELASVATPTMVSRELPILVNNGHCVLTERLTIASRDFAGIAGDSRSVLFLGVTLGREVDRLIRKKSAASMSEGFIYDAIASAMVENLTDLAEEMTTSGREHTGRFSPGYGDMPLEIQGELLSLIEGSRLLGITLTDSGLMSPTKSVTALIGLK